MSEKSTELTGLMTTLMIGYSPDDVLIALSSVTVTLYCWRNETIVDALKEHECAASFISKTIRTEFGRINNNREKHRNERKQKAGL